MVAQVNNMSKTVQVRYSKIVPNLYFTKWYNIPSIYVDIEFQCIQEEIKIIELKACDTENHIHKIEVSIYTTNGHV